MGVRYCGDSERRELFEKWRRPPKAEGRSDRRTEGGREGQPYLAKAATPAEDGEQDRVWGPHREGRAALPNGG